MTERAWPEDWADRMAGKDCTLCGALGTGDNDFSVAVFTGDVAEVRLERRTRLPGYCIVAWRLGHVAEPADLDPGQASRYWTEATAAGPLPITIGWWMRISPCGRVRRSSIICPGISPVSTALR
jgi:hypothetical protein